MQMSLLNTENKSGGRYCRMVVKGGGGGGTYSITPPYLCPFLQLAHIQMFNDDVYVTIRLGHLLHIIEYSQ